MRSKPLADVAECPFVRNIFVIFSRITLSFKKRLSLFTSDQKVIYLTKSDEIWTCQWKLVQI
jgi:hypothetical protein